MAITSKEINPDQLNAELGNRGIIVDFNNPKEKIILPAENSGLTENEIENAIESHIAGPTEAEIKMLNKQEGIAKLKELGFTNDQIQALLNG